MQWFEKTLDSGSKWKCAHIVLVWTVENASKWKRWPKISQVHVLVAWAKSLTYVTTCNSIVFKCFSVHGYWKTCQKGSVDMKRSMCFQWQHTFEKALVWSGGPFRPGTCVPTSRGPRKHVIYEMRGKEETPHLWGRIADFWLPLTLWLCLCLAILFLCLYLVQSSPCSIGETRDLPNYHSWVISDDLCYLWA